MLSFLETRTGRSRMKVLFLPIPRIQHMEREKKAFEYEQLGSFQRLLESFRKGINIGCDGAALRFHLDGMKRIYRARVTSTN